MELEKFDPVCAAVLKKTEIEKPAYPVIDFHMHMGKMLLGESKQSMTRRNMSGNCKMPALYAL